MKRKMSFTAFVRSFKSVITAVLAVTLICSSYSSQAQGESWETQLNTYWVYSDQSPQTINQPLVRSDDGSYYRLTVPAESFSETVKSMEIIPEFGKANAGDDGFYLLTQGELITFRNLPDCSYNQNAIYMPIMGIKTPQGCWLAIVKGMAYDYRIITRVKNGEYRLSILFPLNGRKPYEDIVIDFYPLTGDEATYSGVARRYRQYQLDRGAVRPLTERVKDSSVLAYAAESMEVRIRQGWKPVPSPIDYQTPETEPPMKAVITFERVGEILDEFKRQGIDKAEICLVGWNIGGHDGRYPQIFPADERLGGEQKLRQLIKKAQSMGYQIVCHTNNTDGYSIGEGFSEDLVLKNPDGSLNHPKTTWGGGRMYCLCPKPVWEQFPKSDFPKLADMGFKGVHYIDVISTVMPRTCSDPNHPLTTKQCAEYWNRILAYGREMFGAVGSEGAFDFCAGNLDYCLYATFKKISEPPKGLVAQYVPIFQLVYNGIILSNPATEGVNYTTKDPQVIQKIVEYNGRPIFYFYSKFKHDGGSWMGDTDLTCGTEQELTQSVGFVKQGYDEFNRRLKFQYLFMDDHCQIAENVFRMKYSDGSEIIVNYSDADYNYNGKSVPAKGDLIIGAGK